MKNRSPRRLARAVCVVAVTGALALPSGVPAHAHPHRIPRYYTATITPADAASGSETTFVFRITESAGSKGSIGSANVYVPAGFAVLDPSTVTTFDMSGAPTGKTWTATVGTGGSTIELRTPPAASAKLRPPSTWSSPSRRRSPARRAPTRGRAPGDPHTTSTTTGSTSSSRRASRSRA